MILITKTTTRMHPSPCPVCKSSARKHLVTRNGFVMYRCSTCKTLYLDPIPDAYASLYDSSYFMGGEKGYGYPNYDEEKQVTVRTFERYLDLIASETSIDTFLDIGAATGFFLERAQARGYQVVGVELSSYARTLMEQKGIHSYETTKPLLEKKEQFSVVTLLDTIEHTHDPDTMLKDAYALLKDHGVLAINTPDAGSLMAKITGGAWHLIIPPEHVYLFTKKSLAMLLKRNGFELIKTAKVGKRFTIHYLFRLLANERRESRILRTLASFSSKHWIGSVSFSLNTRDNIFVLAKKI